MSNKAKENPKPTWPINRMPCSNCEDMIDIVVYLTIKHPHDGIINTIAPHNALGHDAYCPNCGQITDIAFGYEILRITGAGYGPSPDNSVQLIRNVDMRTQPYYAVWKGVLKSNKKEKWPYFDPIGITDIPDPIKKAFGIC